MNANPMGSILLSSISTLLKNMGQVGISELPNWKKLGLVPIFTVSPSSFRLEVYSLMHQICCAKTETARNCHESGLALHQPFPLVALFASQPRWIAIGWESIMVDISILTWSINQLITGGAPPCRLLA